MAACAKYGFTMGDIAWVHPLDPPKENLGLKEISMHPMNKDTEIYFVSKQSYLHDVNFKRADVLQAISILD